MNRYETAKLVAVVAFAPLLALWHFILVRVNQNLPVEKKFSHFSPFPLGEWVRFRAEYRRLYPRSYLYPIATTGVFVYFLFALAMIGFRGWEYLAGK